MDEPMNVGESGLIKNEYLNYISTREFACVAARAAHAKQQVQCMVAENIFCPNDDAAILEFIYDFIDAFRMSDNLFHSATVLFKEPHPIEEESFDKAMWLRLQSLSDLDALRYNYDKRVASDPASPDFSFSLKEEAFFIIGLHPSNSRVSRQFKYPAIVFNPHAQFEALRKSGGYDKLKTVVRKRDIISSGTVNPMLEDFGNSSEVYQYSGRIYDKSWLCPLKIHHATS